VNVPPTVPQVNQERERVELQHCLIMSVDSSSEDKRLKVYKERMNLEEKIIGNYEKFGWNVSKPLRSIPIST